MVARWQASPVPGRRRAQGMTQVCTSAGSTPKDFPPRSRTSPRRPARRAGRPTAIEVALLARIAADKHDLKITMPPAPRGRSGPRRRGTSDALVPPGRRRLPRRRLHAPVRRARRGGRAESADQRQVERRRRATSCAGRRRSSGRPTDGADPFDGLRDPDYELKYQTSQIYAVDVASGTIRNVVSAAGRVGASRHLARRPPGGLHRVTRRQARRTPSPISTSVRSTADR